MRAHTLAAVVLAAALVVAPAAQAKFRIRLSLSVGTPVARQAVRVVIRTDTNPGVDCHVLLVAVAPGVDTYDALDAFVAGGGSSFYRVHATARLGFLAPTTRAGPKAWWAAVHFPHAGRWQLVVPNWCAPGYALPPPIVRRVTVRTG